MKLFQKIIALVIVFSINVLIAQEKLPEFRSIHQFEKEKYKDYQIPEKDQLKPFVGKPRPLQARTNPPSKEVFGYLPYWVYNTYPNLNYDLLTTIAYFGADVNASGNITNDHNWPAAGLIDMAHANGVRVVLTVILFNSSELATLLNSPTNRTNLVNNLLASVQSAGADGVSIDFEGIPSGQRSNLTAFMTELTDAFHSAIPGSFVTIFTPAVDWNSVFDYNALAQITDGLVIQGYDYHYGGSNFTGPNAPLIGTSLGIYNITWTVNDYLSKTGGNAEKLIQTVPFFGFDWPAVSNQKYAATTGSGTSVFYSAAYANAQTYGRLWDAETLTPWYVYQDGSQWHQGWYDDSLSIALKFQFFKDKNLKGTGIWALSYDGQRLELQGALADAFGSTAPPLRPAALNISNTGSGDVKVAVQAASGATSYEIYRSSDGVNFNDGTNYPSSANVLTTLSTDTTYFFRVSAVNGNGESNQTEMLGVRPDNNNADVLVVNGFDRTSGTTNTFDFIRQFAPSIVNAGYSFDACANEAIQEGIVSLENYPMVIWISGEEGTSDESFSNMEQSFVSAYLESGGRLFISGSEIGYDLIAQGSSADQAFYNNFLKTQYVRDQVSTHSASAVSGGIFDGMGNFFFDDGNHGTYNVDYPDGINPRTGAQLCLSYTGFTPSTFGGAGVQYSGTFGNGTETGRLVYLGFPFETIYPESVRDELMHRVLTFLSDGVVGIKPVAGTSVPEHFSLAQNYPNPFNPETTIAFDISGNESADVQLNIFNLRGQLVRKLVSEKLSPGQYEVRWNAQNSSGQPVASGVYLYQLRVGDVIQVRKMQLIR
ncbi:MAG: glycosyl hydrolase family 18 protein [Calditrichia bacterium]